MSGAAADVDERVDARLDAMTSSDRPWATILWDDPVTLQPYVLHVLQRHFRYGRERATELMLQAERDGRAVVAQGSREEQELHVAALHAAGLMATLEPLP